MNRTRKIFRSALFGLAAIFATAAPSWAQVPVPDAQKLVDTVTGVFTPDVVQALIQAQAERELHFFIAGLIVLLVANAITVWRATRAASKKERTRWLKELAAQWLLAACTFTLVKFGMVTVDTAVLGCILAGVVLFFLANRHVRRLRANAEAGTATT